MTATEKQAATLERKLTVTREVALSLINAGLHTTRLARAASAVTLTAIPGINASKANQIRAGQ